MTAWLTMEVLSDLSLAFLIFCVNAVAFDALRVARRVGWLSAVGAFAVLAITLAGFFDSHTIVYWDRRFDIVPSVDLHQLLGFRWQWALRLPLAVAFVVFWRAMRPRQSARLAFHQMAADQQRHELAALEQALLAKKEIYRRQHVDGA